MQKRCLRHAHASSRLVEGVLSARVGLFVLGQRVLHAAQDAEHALTVGVFRVLMETGLLIQTSLASHPTLSITAPNQHTQVVSNVMMGSLLRTNNVPHVHHKLTIAPCAKAMESAHHAIKTLFVLGVSALISAKSTSARKQESQSAQSVPSGTNRHRMGRRVSRMQCGG